MYQQYLQNTVFKKRLVFIQITLLAVLTGISTNTFALRFDPVVGHIAGGGVTHDTNNTHQLLIYTAKRPIDSQRMTIGGISLYLPDNTQKTAALKTDMTLRVMTGQISIGEKGKKSRELSLKGTLASINKKLADLRFFAGKNTGSDVKLIIESTSKNLQANVAPSAPAVINITLDEDASTTTNVLARASDQNKDTLSLNITQQPKHGRLKNANGLLTYTPDEHFHGNDNILLTISDGKGGKTTTQLKVTVNAINDAVQAPVSLAINSDEDQAVTLDILAQATDIDGDTLTFRTQNAPKNGKVTTQNNQLVYTPNHNFNGDDQITVQISDGNGSTVNTQINVQVASINDPVVAPESISITVDEDNAVTENLVSLASDLDGDTIRINSHTQAQRGTVSIQGDAVRYQPNTDINGTDAFSVTLTDGNGSNVAMTMNVTIKPVNDAPVAPPSINATTNEDTPVTIDTVAQASDIDGDPLTAQVKTQPQNGTVTVKSNQLVYTPNNNFHGADSFIASIDDGKGGQVETTINLTINAINDPIKQTQDTLAVNAQEDTPATVDVITQAGISDTDHALNQLVMSVIQQPTKGTVTINNGQLTYTPQQNDHGTQTLVVSIADPEGSRVSVTLNLIIASVNDPIVAPTSTALTVDEDDSGTLNVVGLASDVDGDTLRIESHTQAQRGAVSVEGGSVRYQPNADVHGPDTFAVTLTDGQGDTHTITLNVMVNPTNDDPTALPEITESVSEDGTVTTAVLFQAQAADVDGDALSLGQVITQPLNGSVLRTGNELRYTPKANFNGTDAATVEVVDGKGGQAQTVIRYTVKPVNDVPTAGSQISSTGDEDTGQSIAVLSKANAADVDGDALSVTMTIAPGNGSAVVDANGTMTYTPNSNFNGVDQAVVVINDGHGGTVETTVTFAVKPVNDPVQAPTSLSLSGNEDTSITTDPAAQASDNDNDAITIASFSQGQSGSVTVEKDIVRYTPTTDFHGNDTFTVTLTDGNGSNVAMTMNVTVKPVNDAPVAPPSINATTNEDTPVTIDTVAQASDIDGDPLTAQVKTQPQNGTVTVKSNQLVYTPNNNFHGADSFIASIDDGKGGTVEITITLAINAVNDKPVAPASINVMTNEDTPTRVNAIAQASDPDADPLTVTVKTQPQNGTVTVKSNQLVYTPNNNFHGADSFIASIDDGNGGQAETTINLTVNPVNDPPTAKPEIAVTTTEDGSITTPALTQANANDIDGDALSILIQSTPQNGQATASANGTVTYTPNTDFNGKDQLTLTLDDGNGGTTNVLVNITVTSVNDPVQQTQDTLAVNAQEDTPATVDVITQAGISDTDHALNQLVMSVIQQPTKGTVTINNGQLTYTPQQNDHGTQTLVVSIADPEGSRVSVTLNLIIASVNDPIVAPTSTALTVDEDDSGTLNVVGLASDVDGDTLRIESHTQAQRGAVSVEGGSVRYQPNADVHGPDTFAVTLTDGQGDTHTITLNVMVNPTNDDPTALPEITESVSEDGTVTTAVLFQAQAADVDGDALSLGQVITQPLNGSVLRTGNELRYTPKANFNGTDAATVEVVDGKGGQAQTVIRYTVKPVNDVPTAGSQISSTGDEDTGQSIAVLSKANAADVDGDALSVTMTIAPGNGSAVVDANGTMTYTPNSNFNGVDQAVVVINDGHGGTVETTVTFAVKPVNDPVEQTQDALSVSTVEDTSATVDVFSQAGISDADHDLNQLIMSVVQQPAKGAVTINNGQLTYAPQENDHGNQTMVVSIADPEGSSVSVTLNITIASVNDPVTQAKDILTSQTEEDTSVTVAVFTQASIADTDHALSDLTMTVTQQPIKGAVTINAGQLTYTPQENDHGQQTITLRIADPQGSDVAVTVNLTIAPVNDPIVAPTTESIGVDEDASVTKNIVALASDIDGDTIRIATITQGQNGTVSVEGDTVRYQPNPDVNGNDTFTATLTDGNGDTHTITLNVTINPINDDPTAQPEITETVDEDDAATTNVLTKANANDIDTGDSLTLGQVITPPSKGTFTQINDREARYTPKANFHGDDTVTVEIVDGNGGKTQTTIRYTITPVNDAPTANAQISNTGDEDKHQVINVLTQANANDIDGDTLTLALKTSPQNGTATVDANGIITYSPTANFNGTDQITTTIADGNGGTIDTTINLTINAVNDAPTAPANIAQTTDEDNSVIINVVAQANDIDEDPLTITTKTQPQNGSVAVESNQLVYTPNNDFNGADTFIAIITDGNGGSVDTTINLTVNSVNDTPTATAQISNTGDEDTTQSIAVLSKANAADVDGDALSVTITFGPTNGTAAVDANGTLTYTPTANFNGTDQITVTIADGNGGTVDTTINLTLNAVNDAPTAPANITQTTDEDNSVTIDAIAQANDIDEDPLTVTPKTQPQNGNVTVENNQLVYTPNNDFNGADTFIATIADGNGGSVDTTINLTIEAVNDPPIVNASTTQTGNEDETIAIPSINLNDVDASNGNLELALSIQNGTLTFAATAGLNFPNPAFGNGSAQLIVQGTLGALQAALPSLQYQGNKDYHGSDTLTVVANDQGNTGKGGALASETKTIALTISPVNDVPVVALTQPQITAEFIEGQGAITFATGQISDVDTGDQLTKLTLTLAQTPDGDDETLTPQQLGTALSGTYTNGMLTITGPGTLADYTRVLQGVTYNNLSRNPTTTTRTVAIIAFDVEGQSNPANTQIRITAVNDTPEGRPDTATVEEDAPNGVTIDVLANDSDPENSTLTITSAQTPAGGHQVNITDNKIVFIPAENANGVIEFNYTVSDGELTDTQSVTVTITPVNDEPVLTVADEITMVEGEEKTITRNEVVATDIDNSDDQLTFTVTDTQHGTWTVNGQPATTFTQQNINNGLVKYTATMVNNDDVSADLQITVSDQITTSNNDTQATQTNTPTTTKSASTETFQASSDASAIGSILNPILGTLQSFFTTTATTTLKILHRNRAPNQIVPMDAVPGLIHGITKLIEPSVNDTDAKGKPLSVSFTAAHGTFYVSPFALQTTHLTALQNTLISTSQTAINPLQAAQNINISGNNSNDITITAPVDTLLKLFSDGHVEYHAPHDISGDITLTMLTSDNGNTGVGGAKVAQDEFTINLNQLNLADVNEKNGVVITGQEQNANIGQKVQAIGDINGDGYTDFATSNGYFNLDRGHAYIFFGGKSGPSTTNINNLNGYNGFSLHDENAHDYVDFNISSGDINGDGIDDIIIGAPYVDTGGTYTGTTYVVFGQTTFSPNLALSTLNGQNGFSIHGENAYDYTGRSVSSGDINGDGIDDIILGAPNADTGGTNTGTTYVVFGQTTFSPNLALSTLNGQNGFSIHGEKARNYVGLRISSGDINGDGKDDIILGAPYADTGGTYTGTTYVVFGQTTFSPNLALSTLNGQNGFSIHGENAYDYTGHSVSSGDINGDGKDDIILGAPFADTGGTDTGTTYVVFGQTTFSSNLALSTLNGQNGFSIHGENAYDYIGLNISSGDINGDGKDDIILGAPYADTGGTYTGTTYVVFGQTTFSPNLGLSTLNGQNGFSIHGENAYDYIGLNISSGDINGDGKDDIILSAPFADTATISNAGKIYIIYGQRDFGRQ